MGFASSQECSLFINHNRYAGRRKSYVETLRGPFVYTKEGIRLNPKTTPFQLQTRSCAFFSSTRSSFTLAWQEARFSSIIFTSSVCSFTRSFKYYKWLKTGNVRIKKISDQRSWYTKLEKSFLDPPVVLYVLGILKSLDRPS